MRPCALILAMTVAAGAPLAAAAVDSLPGPSPFLPAAGSQAAEETPDAPIELRGVVTNDGTTMFSIYDTARKSSDWVGLNESGHPYTVRNYDEAHDTVTVDFQGRSLTLALHTAKVAAAPVTLPATPAGMVIPPPSQQPPGGPAVLHPTPADEKRRLEAIAAEVNRRRMLRQQALQASRRAQEQAQQTGRPPPPPNSR
ncbi:MAG TPA: hypothetical protein VHE13_05300 [Opitutus sp.]|nr:hypothetical protein [Opitutus sp.]